MVPAGRTIRVKVTSRDDNSPLALTAELTYARVTDGAAQDTVRETEQFSISIGAEHSLTLDGVDAAELGRLVLYPGDRAAQVERQVNFAPDKKQGEEQKSGAAEENEKSVILKDKRLEVVLTADETKLLRQKRPVEPEQIQGARPSKFASLVDAEPDWFRSTVQVTPCPM